MTIRLIINNGPAQNTGNRESEISDAELRKSLKKRGLIEDENACLRYSYVRSGTELKPLVHITETIFGFSITKDVGDGIGEYSLNKREIVLFKKILTPSPPLHPGPGKGKPTKAPTPPGTPASSGAKSQWRPLKSPESTPPGSPVSPPHSAAAPGRPWLRLAEEATPPDSSASRHSAAAPGQPWLRLADDEATPPGSPASRHPAAAPDRPWTPLAEEATPPDPPLGAAPAPVFGAHPMSHHAPPPLLMHQQGPTIAHASFHKPQRSPSEPPPIQPQGSSAQPRFQSKPDVRTIMPARTGQKLENRNRIDASRTKTREEVRVFLKQLQVDAEQVLNLNGKALEQFKLQGSLEIPRGILFYSIPGPVLKNLMMPTEEKALEPHRSSRDLSTPELLMLLRTHSRFQPNKPSAPETPHLTGKVVYDAVIKRYPLIYTAIQTVTGLRQLTNQLTRRFPSIF